MLWLVCGSSLNWYVPFLYAMRVLQSRYDTVWDTKEMLLHGDYGTSTTRNQG